MNSHRAFLGWATVAFLFVVASVSSLPAAETVWLSSLDVSKTEQGFGQPQADKSVMGKQLSIAGRKFDRGRA